MAVETARAEVALAADAHAKATAGITDPKRCEADSDLTPERQALLPGWSPTFLFFGRFGVRSQSSDYFDPSNGASGTDRVHPISFSAGLGSFLLPTLLAGVGLRYGRDRSIGDTSTVCTNQQVGGATTTPPTLVCNEVAVGTPTWKSSTTLRFEVRQYLTPVVGWNPSLSYAYSDANDEFPLFKSQGAWSFELPVYFRVTKTGPFLFGAAYSRKETFGLGEKNDRSNDAFIFLAANFGLASFAKK